MTSARLSAHSEMTVLVVQPPPELKFAARFSLIRRCRLKTMAPFELQIEGCNAGALSSLVYPVR